MVSCFIVLVKLRGLLARQTGMKLRPKITLIDHFTPLNDPRIDRTKEHKLIDIVIIAICAVICGAPSLGGKRNLWQS